LKQIKWGVESVLVRNIDGRDPLPISENCAQSDDYRRCWRTCGRQKSGPWNVGRERLPRLAPEWRSTTLDHISSGDCWKLCDDV